jgi:heme oxygenase
MITFATGRVCRTLPTDFRTVLAQATRAAHEAVEAQLRLDGDATLERYVAYLRTMHAVSRLIEPQTSVALAALGLDAQARGKCAWLERDLAHFGVAPVAPAAMRIPGTVAARMGWAYVLEGSTLGGRVLYAQLAPRWSLTPERGAAFLCGYGARTGRMWRAFVDALNALEPDDAAMHESVAAAKDAFIAIGETFRRSIAGADLAVEHDGGGRGLAA